MKTPNAREFRNIILYYKGSLTIDLHKMSILLVN